MTTRMLPTPADMIEYLDRFVRGQARAKQDIPVAVYNHYLSQAYRERHFTRVKNEDSNRKPTGR